MKTNYLIFLMLINLLRITIPSYGQLNEHFESSTFPPTSWVIYAGANGLGSVQQWKSNTYLPH